MYQIPCLSVKPHRKSQMRIKNLVSAFNYTDAAKLAFKEIREYHPKGIPILVIASDMYYLNKLEELLRIQGWKYKRLDAHNIEEEDSIINQAGLKDNITLSSNVTGRGVDIILGGTIKTHNRANNKISYQLISERIAQERN